MPPILQLRNPVRNYPWGSRTAIASLLGRPAAEPEAELWMGAHPQAPSEVLRDGRWTSLRDLIRERPEEILGADLAARTGGELPFLFKVLAAEAPLSIQAHPDRGQAERGCRREDELGIPREAPQRSYRDPHPKPEILCALTPFSILRGFRPPEEIYRLVARAGLVELLPECRELAGSDPCRALESFFTAYMSRPAEQLAAILTPALDRCRQLAMDEPYRWVLDFAARYPGDRGVLSPLILHLHELRPGEAIHTGPGILHAYLRGVGMELMTSSDNVLRGGLTAKHVDVPELLDVLRFEPLEPKPLRPAFEAGGRRFEADGLVLEALEVGDGSVELDGGQVAILMCTGGGGVLNAAAGVEIRFAKGDSFLLPAASESVRVTGPATLFRAGATGW